MGGEGKFLSYVILPNFVYENHYKKCSLNVFNSRSLEWTPVFHFSQYWYQFPEYLCYSYPMMKKVIKMLTDELLENDCTYHREKFAVFSDLFLEQKMGETVFVKYLTLKDMDIVISKDNLEKATITV